MIIYSLLEVCLMLSGPGIESLASYRGLTEIALAMVLKKFM